MKLRAQKIKEGCKRSQQAQVGGSKAKARGTKRAQNAAFGKRQNGRARHHHGLLVMVSTDHGGGMHGRTVWTHDRASPACPGFFAFLSCLFVVLLNFSVFCPLKIMYLDILERHSTQFQFTHHSPYSLELDQVREGWREKKKFCERDGELSEHRKIQGKPPNLSISTSFSFLFPI